MFSLQPSFQVFTHLHPNPIASRAHIGYKTIISIRAKLILIIWGPNFIYHLDPEGWTVHFHQVGHVTFHAVHFQIHPQSLLGSGTTE